LVKEQLFIKAEALPWDYCRNEGDKFFYTSSDKASQFLYVELKGKYKILKYSGDTDGSVPTYGTQMWINDLGWAIEDAWRPYYISLAET